MGKVENLLRVLLTLTIALIIGGLIVQLSGKDAINAYQVLFDSAFGSDVAIANTLLAATPLIFTGLATVVAFRAGVFNVGVEGSLYIGAFAAAWAGFTFTGLPGFVLIPLIFIAGGLAGGLWGLIPGYLKARLRVDEVVTTIMFNYIAILLTDYLVSGPFLLEGMSNAMSEEIAPQAQLVRIIPKSQWNISFFVALAAYVFVFLMLRRMTLGYEINALGTNPVFTRWSGMHVGKIIMVVMFISGFIGGLAGSGQVGGVHYRYISGFSPGLGFTGIVVALLGRNTPTGALLAALFFGALRNGGSTMELFTRIPRDLIDILQALIIFFVAIELSLTWLRFRRKRAEPGLEPAQG
ncbi:MAG: ABC transporter permease [Anaerolineae bacterium]|nr:ABC transporter permease [Anaerolineae bacterium]